MPKRPLSTDRTGCCRGFLRPGAKRLIAPRIAGVLSWAVIASAMAQSANDYFKRGFELLREGEAQSAVEIFRKGLALEPDNGLARLYLGRALERREPSDEISAEAEYRRAAELLKGRVEAEEAATLAQKIADKRAKSNLLVNKTLLDGKWCFKLPAFAGYYGIKGKQVDIVETNGRDTGTLEILSESRFSITQKGFFSGSVAVMELVGTDAFRGISVNGTPYTGNNLTRRCN